jgi:hypothetical protein
MAVTPAEVEKFLRGVNYPARKEDLIKHGVTILNEAKHTLRP